MSRNDKKPRKVRPDNSKLLKPRTFLFEIENVEQKKKQLNIKLLELETLFDIGVAISSVLNVDELAEDVLFRAIGVLNASKGMFVRQNNRP